MVGKGLIFFICFLLILGASAVSVPFGILIAGLLVVLVFTVFKNK